MSWVLAGIGTIILVLVCWVVFHGIFDSANRVLEVIDNSPPAGAVFPRGNCNDEV